MAKKLALPFLGAAILLASCGEADFTDETQKQQAFGNYICARDADSGVDWSTHVAAGVIADNAASKADKAIALDLMIRTDEAYEAQVEMARYGREMPISPRLDPADDGQCNGWVWEKHILSEFDKEYDDFNYEIAGESGSLPE